MASDFCYTTDNEINETAIHYEREMERKRIFLASRSLDATQGKIYTFITWTC